MLQKVKKIYLNKTHRLCNNFSSHRLNTERTSVLSWSLPTQEDQKAQIRLQNNVSLGIRIHIEFRAHSVGSRLRPDFQECYSSL